MNNDTLEFKTVLEKLADFALSENVKNKLLTLEPYKNEKELKLNMTQTTEACNILKAQGTPPIASMQELDKILSLAEKGGMLSVLELCDITTFLSSCDRIISYLERAKSSNINLSLYSDAFYKLDDLYNEINFCIRNGIVDSNASPKLRDIRRKIENAKTSIEAKLLDILKSKKNIFAENYVVMRNGVKVLPVKKEYRNQISGTVIDTSNTGGTVFIEPKVVQKLQQELYLLEIDEDNEIRTILYTLTALVESHIKELRSNMNYMEMLDFVFAKAKLSLYMNGIEVPVLTDRSIVIKKGRHPLIDKEKCVPLDFEIGNGINGIVITGPNTGGKTVSLKTVGLLSMMAQSGLHVPVLEGSKFSMNINVLCDIGDGQSISESLSTFSSHIKNIIEILENVTPESLVLLDELGSGTDPKEGMGIAISILEELRKSDCLFVATTHYPEVKDYADKKEGVINARMEFDKDSLRPLYKLVIGEAGESCAFYIAKKLGLPEHMLKLAEKEAYGISNDLEYENTETKGNKDKINVGKIVKDDKIVIKNSKIHNFNIGDSVRLLTTNDVGIVSNIDDEKGNILVLVKDENVEINHKRVKLIVSASELYPEDYDFSIIFDTVSNRKLRNQMKKRHVEGKVIEYKN